MGKERVLEARMPAAAGRLGDGRSRTRTWDLFLVSKTRRCALVGVQSVGFGQGFVDLQGILRVCAEAEAIYDQGRDVVVAVLLRMDEHIRRLATSAWRALTDPCFETCPCVAGPLPDCRTRGSRPR